MTSAPREHDPSIPPTIRQHRAKRESRPTHTLWRANPREQGLIGLTDAIAWFGANGYLVNVPLIDAQSYDLVVDDGATLQRVQVKTTTQRRGNGRFQVQLCTRGGNQSFHTTSYFDPCAVELLYLLTDDGQRYLLPSEIVRARTGLTLNDRHLPYLIER